MSFRSVLVCYTAGFTTIITTLRRITIGKEIYFLRTGILQTKTMCLATADNRNSSTGEENHHCKKYRYYCITETFIIRKTKCSSVLKQNVLFYKTKRTSVNLFSYPNWHKKAPKKYVFFGAFYCSVFWLSHQKSLTLNKYIIFGFNAILIPLKRRYIIPPESWARHRLYSIMSVYVAL